MHCSSLEYTLATSKLFLLYKCSFQCVLKLVDLALRQVSNSNKTLNCYLFGGILCCKARHNAKHQAIQSDEQVWIN